MMFWSSAAKTDTVGSDLFHNLGRTPPCSGGSKLGTPFSTSKFKYDFSPFLSPEGGGSLPKTGLTPAGIYDTESSRWPEDEALLFRQSLSFDGATPKKKTIISDVTPKLQPVLSSGVHWHNSGDECIKKKGEQNEKPQQTVSFKNHPEIPSLHHNALATPRPRVNSCSVKTEASTVVTGSGPLRPRNMSKFNNEGKLLFPTTCIAYGLFQYCTS